MDRESANQTLRQIQTLYATGPVGAVSDARLVERFLDREGADREDAFSALVQRHGPSVLGVCRRMLAGSADADDAFQAVFLVLARKAGSLRGVQSLKPWLHAVAVRTAKEARRRSARLQAREGASLLVEPPAASSADSDLFELRGLLDEELQRLPSRYREPLLLCELEGASRQDAARRLGLPEGTLSTRLARGRVLLRNRLTRRGVAVSAMAAMIPEPVKAASVGPLAAASTRLALKFTARNAGAGAVPAVVASLAEGVLHMLATAKLKAVLLTTSALVAACLSAGLAWGFVVNQGPPAAQAEEVAVQEVEAPKARKTPQPLQARGVVVDEAGQPVAGAEVWVDAYTIREHRGVTGPDGAFAIPVPEGRLDGRSILVRVDAGRKLGVFRYGYDLTRAQTDEPSRIVVKPSREVVVHVADDHKAPIADAVVEVVGNYRIFAHAPTGTDGSARLAVPVDAQVNWIVAKKAGAGFDYAEFGKFDEAGRDRGGSAPAELPDSVALTLEAPRTARIKAVDQDGEPAAGVDFYIWLLQKEGRRSMVNYQSRIHIARTGPDGIATFDWLPQSKNLLQFFPFGEHFANRRVVVEEGQTEAVVTRLARTEAIRGRVVRPDGSPAKDVEVVAYGTGQGMDHGQGGARTDDDGMYEMIVAPNEAYAVYVDDKDWTAPSRLDVVVRPGKPVDGVDFQLTKGTILKGLVTVGTDDRPKSGEYIRVDESGGNAPEDLHEKGDHVSRQVRRQFGMNTDAQGRYAIRVGPGTFTLMGPPRTRNETITVTNEAEVVHDFRMPRPEKGPLSGRVVAGPDAKPVANARVSIASANMMSIPFEVTTDDEGRFQTERNLDKTFLCAKSPDDSLGALVEIGPEDPEVVITLTPTATATGLLLDEQGKPATNQKLEWGRRIYLDEEQGASMTVFAPKVVTDDQGRFTLPSLVVGQKYSIAVLRDNALPAAGIAFPEKPGPLDLGTLQVGAYIIDEQKAASSSFRQNAPDAGAVAPAIDATTLDGKPLTLKDFAGKYVLLDFWATWCGPCLAEIPQLQAVHDAFGKDERFAILSLSVDESIDDPRKFQETRKLPWSQGFLSGGLHGDKPGAYGVQAIPAFVLIGPDGKLIARGMRGKEIQEAVAKALEKTP